MLSSWSGYATQKCADANRVVLLHSLCGTIGLCIARAPTTRAKAHASLRLLRQDVACGGKLLRTIRPVGRHHGPLVGHSQGRCHNNAARQIAFRPVRQSVVAPSSRWTRDYWGWTEIYQDPPVGAPFIAIVHGDSTRATVSVTAEWIDAHGKQIKCSASSKTWWEQQSEAAIKTRAQRR